MKRYVLLWSLLWLVCSALKAQESASPYTLKTAFTGDFVNNFHGGLRTGHNYIGKIDLSLGFSTEKAGWYNGGKLFVRAINAHGGNPSAKFVGDIQPVSRIEAQNRTSLFEFWYSQDIGRFRLLLGQFDMNSAFAVNALASNFTNTSFGMYPSVALNVPLSIYPAAAAAVFGEWKSTENLTMRAAVFDGAPLSFEQNPNNLKWDIHLDGGLFSTVELEYKEMKDEAVHGTYKLGGYLHNGQHRSLADTSRLSHKSYGVYLTLERKLLRENNEDHQGLAAFLQSGTSPGAGNLVDFYFSSGLVYTGIVPSRPKDLLGLGIVHSSINDKLREAKGTEYSRSRNLLQFYYKLNLGENFSLQPDLQYVFNPGAKSGLENALVGIMRIEVHY